MTHFQAVSTTSIYCLPDCSGKPNPEHVTVYPLAATAEANGYRACLRCRPYRSSEPMEWLTAPEIVCRAVRLVLSGALDRGKEEDLARDLGVSNRHLRRLFNEHLGTTPDQLARSSRAHFARRLLDDTDYTVADIAWLSGYGSVRQLNRDFRRIFHASPTELRARRHSSDRLVADGGLMLRLPFEGPFDWDWTLSYLAHRAIPGVEAVSNGVYRRTIDIEGKPGLLEFSKEEDQSLFMVAHLPRWQPLLHLVQRSRRMFGLDFNQTEAVEQLSEDPVVGPLVKDRPGIRIPGCWSPFEAAVEAIAAQGVGQVEARRRTRRLVEAHGTEVQGLAPFGLSRVFPSPHALADMTVPISGRQRRWLVTVRSLAVEVTEGRVRLDGSDTLDNLMAALTKVDGLGPSTAGWIAMRIGERDALPDLTGLLRPIPTLKKVDDIQRHAARWKPWRALAATHLFAVSLDSEVLGDVV